MGQLGCQADKTVEATTLLADLIRTPPISETRYVETQRAIEQDFRTQVVRFREVPETVLRWEEMGLMNGDPRPARFSRALAYSLADLDRSAGSQTATQLEAEISRLENDANPLDTEASETRVKRLAFLKRQRRGVADVLERRKQIAGKLETCASALASMKLDLNRLSVGSANFQNITSLANEAMSLAKSVDHVLSAADEVGRLTSDRVAPRAI
jgi:hypothetical protein